MVGESHSRGGSSLVSRGISLVDETLHRVLSLLVTSLESLKAIYSYWLIKALENRIMSNLISHLNNPNNVNSKIHGGMSRSRVLNHHPLTQWRNRCSSGTGLEGGGFWGGVVVLCLGDPFGYQGGWGHKHCGVISRNYHSTVVLGEHQSGVSKESSHDLFICNHHADPVDCHG